MPRTASKPRPFFAITDEFVDALDNVVQEALNLEGAIKTILDLDLVQGGAREILIERMGAFKAALDIVED